MHGAEAMRSVPTRQKVVPASQTVTLASGRLSEVASVLGSRSMQLDVHVVSFSANPDPGIEVSAGLAEGDRLLRQDGCQEPGTGALEEPVKGFKELWTTAVSASATGILAGDVRFLEGTSSGAVCRWLIFGGGRNGYLDSSCGNRHAAVETFYTRRSFVVAATSRSWEWRPYEPAVIFFARDSAMHGKRLLSHARGEVGSSGSGLGVQSGDDREPWNNKLEVLNVGSLTVPGNQVSTVAIQSSGDIVYGSSVREN
ncbi:hypothetical protein NE237_005222 [Protea cynaroides]|uniref:Uncharacterized protein n=1 Tax=Protea cynaroides TaxID=273540 RepID=A0A9Q0KK45_9MAGN|nr:hypothetical protein NE237_005222 [Protea cynaroides]